MAKKYNVTSLVSSDKIDFIRLLDEFSSVSPGQTAFGLAKIPFNVNTIVFRVNGVSYRRTVDFTVSSATVTWTDAAFVLEAGDIVEIEYDFSS